MDVRAKNVIITGGARGLGRALVERLVERQASVTVIDKDAALLHELARSEPRVACVECDVAHSTRVFERIAQLCAHRGPPDILINNAGRLFSAPLVSMTSSGVAPHDISAWDQLIADDLSSVFYVTRSVVAQMVPARVKGLIVNVSSVAAAGNAGQSAYSAAKAGVNALTAVWAKELAPWGIRVAGIAPGFVDTPSTRRAVSESNLRQTVERVPLKRLARVDEIVDGVLAIIENDFFHGKVLELDGGLTL